MTRTSPRRGRPAALALALALGLCAAPALAQPRAAAAGDWLYDEAGEVVGSVKSLSRDGGTATIRLGVYLKDMVRILEVPAGAITVENGRAVLQPETLRMANARAPRG